MESNGPIFFFKNKAMATQFFVLRAVGRIMSGWSVGKITIIISFRVGTFKNKNIDYGVENTGAIMLAQVTYKIDHVSLLQDSTISSVLNCCWTSVSQVL